MRTKLVIVPGHAACLGTLCPKTTPILLAEMLHNEGLLADYLDLTTIASVSSCSTETTVPAQGNKDIAGFLQHFAQQYLSTSNPSLCANGVQDEPWRLTALKILLADPAPDLVSWYIETRDEYQTSKELSLKLRHRAPGIHQTIMGPYVTRYGAAALGNLASVDTGITGDPVSALVALSESIHTPESWGRIPGLVFHNRKGVACSPKNVCPVRNLLPPEQEHFSTRKHTPKHPAHCALYPISFACTCTSGYGLTQGSARPLQKSAAHLLAEMNLLGKHYGAGAFHIEASHISSSTFAKFAETLLARNFMALYSLGGLTEPLDAALADLLFASGCRAVGFNVPSGSQRLLEDFYGCNMSISAIRASLRHCRAAGLFTVVHLCYPCPRDDYHTRAETELFLQACLPDAVTITAPELTPESIWFRRAPEYGFRFQHRAFQNWIECSPQQRQGQPYKMAGWKRPRVEEAQRALALAAKKMGCLINITEQHGLLARIVRSVVDEEEFLKQLKQAIDQSDIATLKLLMAQVNETLDTIHLPAVSMRQTVQAL